MLSRLNARVVGKQSFPIENHAPVDAVDLEAGGRFFFAAGKGHAATFPAGIADGDVFELSRALISLIKPNLLSVASSMMARDWRPISSSLMSNSAFERIPLTPRGSCYAGWSSAPPLSLGDVAGCAEPFGNFALSFRIGIARVNDQPRCRPRAASGVRSQVCPWFGSLPRPPLSRAAGRRGGCISQARPWSALPYRKCNSGYEG